MIFQPDNSRTSRAAHAEDRARGLVQDILDREERVRTNLAAADVDPWEMRFIVDESIHDGAIAAWREEAVRARRLLRRFSIQSGYRERIRDVERRIDAMLHLAETLEELWDAAAAASARLSAAEARDAEAFERERRRQNDAAAARRGREERRERRRRELQRKVGHITADALDRTREAGGGVLRRSLEAGREALEKLPDLPEWPARGRRDGGAEREVRRAEARDLRHQPPLPED